MTGKLFVLSVAHVCFTKQELLSLSRLQPWEPCSVGNMGSPGSAPAAIRAPINTFILVLLST